MDEFAVKVTAKGADGSLAPFHIYVGTPEAVDDIVSGCLTWCSLLEKPHLVKGETLAQAYSLAYRFIAQMVEYAGLTLFDRDGAPFQLPRPPDGFEDEI
ncbi:hypothetical protein [Paramagnetospirillum magneticum]|uniref:Uncharacterized protein n=1 Tax=Paramagnetospirillum magneticum (strain ATCC 700264 / AMB-1) TaxID=342108 RepID=Q2VZY8_PARM1|nr:hypothetical protein [Paramagnetospirillum magneticum]BAE52837.1 hypothetical protein amb4033 [Paramagnetospirillum magneticum AMB-1]